MKNNISSYINIFFYILVLAIICTGIYLRTALYIQQVPFWQDEINLSVNIVDRNLSDVFLPLIADQKAPPLFLLLTMIITKIKGISFLSLRFIPYLSGIISIPLFYIFLKRNLTSKFAIFVGLYLFSINPILTYYSAEFKPYSFAVLVCILLFLSCKYINLKNLSFPKILLYTLISILLILFSFPAMFIIPSIIISKTIEEKYINFKCLFILAGIFITCLYLFLIDTNLYLHMIDFWSNTFQGFLSFSQTNNLQILKKIINDFLNPHSILLSIFLIFLGVLSYRGKKELLLFFILFIIIFLASILKIYPLYPRLTLFLIPVILLLTVKSIEYFNKNKMKYLILIIVILNIQPILNFNMAKNYQTLLSNFGQSYNERICIRDMVKYSLINCQKQDYLLHSAILGYYTLYSIIYNQPNNIKYNLYEYLDEDLIKKYSIDFINKTDKHSIRWIMINEDKSMFLTSQLSFIEQIIKLKNLKYEKIYFNDEYKKIYLIKIFNKKL